VIRVLLCDDAVAFSVLFEHWIGDADDLEVVATARTGDEAVRLAAEQRPGVVVLDHLLQATTSEHLVPRLRRAAPDARILLISGMVADDLERAAAKSGADGFISKASSSDAVRAAVRAVVQSPG
jgi:DNA-binding NarL/FixJ family response regulator